MTFHTITAEDWRETFRRNRPRRNALAEQVREILNPMKSKPTDTEKAEMVRLVRAGMKQVEVARLFRVTPTTVGRVMAADLMKRREAALAARGAAREQAQ